MSEEESQADEMDSHLPSWFRKLRQLADEARQEVEDLPDPETKDE